MSTKGPSVDPAVFLLVAALVVGAVDQQSTHDHPSPFSIVFA
jgi:hypothetical protein